MTMGMEVRQLTVYEANNFALPLIREYICCQTGVVEEGFYDAQDDLVDVWGCFSDNGVLLGSIGFGEALPGLGRYYLGYFVVREGSRRQRIGTKLFKILEKEVSLRRIKELIVETYDSPYFESARKFYEYMGFTRIGAVSGLTRKGLDTLYYVKKYGEDLQ